MKKVLILVLFFIPFLFQNCTIELHEIDAVVVSPDVEYHMANSDDSNESPSALSDSQSSEDLTGTTVKPI
jgi:hypothetical protein